MRRTAAALHVTDGALLLAAAGPGTGVELLVALPAGTAPGTAVARYLGDVPPPVVVLVEGTAAGPVPFPGGPRVLPVPFPVAVLATGPAPPPGPVLVADVAAARAWTVCGPRVTPVPVGPAPSARWVTAAARATGAVQVVLAGDVPSGPGFGGAAAGVVCPVRPGGPLTLDDPAAVPGAGPRTAAVLGAALLGAALLGTAPLGADPDGAALVGTGSVGAGPFGADPVGTDPVGGGPFGTGPAGADPGVAPGPEKSETAADEWPGRVPSWIGRAGARRWPIGVAATLGVALVVAGMLTAGSAPGGGAATGPVDGVVVQYGYAAAVPPGWEHTGGDPARMRTLLTPAGRPDGADLIVVERSRLGYDAGREPDRTARELAALLSGVPGVTGPAPRTVGGRAVLGYTQRDARTVTDWHVVTEGTDQLVAGCRRPAAAPPDPACAVVVTSLRPAP